MTTVAKFPVAPVFSRLFVWANTANFWDIFPTAFGSNYDVATNLSNQWLDQGSWW